MSSHKKQSVGISVSISVSIEELKDRASEVVATVQRTGRAISITKNHQQVASITAIPTDPHERPVAAGLVRPGPKPRPISELQLTPLGVDSSRAVRAILQDRGED